MLPFDNLSPNPENEFFGIGVSEEILDRLGGIEALKVIGRTSSFAFRDRNHPAPKIAALLGVEYLLEGSVRRQGPRVRVSIKLLDARGLQVWARTFDREITDIFAIQGEIADTVTMTVAPQVVPAPEISELPIIEAYDQFLAGRELLYQRKKNASIRALEKAIELDPEFAEAYAELAVAASIGGAPDFERGQTAITQALALQPNLIRAQAARGLLLSQQGEHERAVTVLRGPSSEGRQTATRCSGLPIPWLHWAVSKRPSPFSSAA